MRVSIYKCYLKIFKSICVIDVNKYQMERLGKMSGWTLK